MKHTHFPLQNDIENNILVYNCFITNIHFLSSFCQYDRFVIKLCLYKKVRAIQKRSPISTIGYSWVNPTSEWKDAP